MDKNKVLPLVACDSPHHVGSTWCARQAGWNIQRDSDWERVLPLITKTVALLHSINACHGCLDNWEFNNEERAFLKELGYEIEVQA